MSTPPKLPYSAARIQCGTVLYHLALILNHTKSWVDVPAVAACLTFIQYAAFWFRELGKELTLPELGVGAAFTIAGGMVLQRTHCVREPVLHRLLDVFVRQMMSQGKIYDLSIGVNNSGADASGKFRLLWNDALRRNRMDAPFVRGGMIECIERREVDGVLQTFPDPVQADALRIRIAHDLKKLPPGKKLRILVICGESRTGGTINRVQAALAHPEVEIEVLAIIRREDSNGRINWYFLESNHRYILCSETPKENL